VYYTASSLDGFVADEAGSLDWLLSRDVDAGGPFGYEAFARDVGALVMGSTTYEWIVANQPGEWPYEQPSWVLTHRPGIIAHVLTYSAHRREVVRAMLIRQGIEVHRGDPLEWMRRD
jgi:dihydrofolate reductase